MHASGQREPEINKLFRLASHYKADLYLHGGSAPILRVGGVTRETILPPLSEQDLESVLLPLLFAEQRDCLDHGGEVVFTYACEEGKAFHVTVSKKCRQIRLSAHWLGVAERGAAADRPRD